MVKVSGIEHNQIVETIEQGIAFEVLESDVYGTGVSPSSQHGVILAPGSISVVAVE